MVHFVFLQIMSFGAGLAAGGWGG